MASYKRILQNILNVNGIDLGLGKGVTIKEVKETSIDLNDGIPGHKMGRLDIYVKVSKKADDRCPICHKKCKRYDKHWTREVMWRGCDLGGYVVYIHAETHRILCPGPHKNGEEDEEKEKEKEKENYVLVAEVPWAYPGSRFTKEFDRTVAYLARYLSKLMVSEYMRIDWATVGRCVKRVRKDLEPDISKRWNGLTSIGIDETSYQSGHKYITVVVNHDTNEVVWAGANKGFEVISEFFDGLSPKQKQSIKCVTGDGARWITDAVNQYVPWADRCVDLFHVEEWCQALVTSLRSLARQQAKEELEQVKHGKADDTAPCDPVATGSFEGDLESVGPAKSHPKKKKGKDPAHKQRIKDATKEANLVKRSRFSLRKHFENLTEAQKLDINYIAAAFPELYDGYIFKERLSGIVKTQNIDLVSTALDEWIADMYAETKSTGIKEFAVLAEKVERNKPFIINTIQFHASNARIEAMNNKIKHIISVAYGYRNVETLISMIYLVCSNLVIPLPNRPSTQRRRYY